jgi:hypothetical protein
MNTALVVPAIAALRWRDCVRRDVMPGTLVGSDSEVVSKPSPFGRSRVEASPAMALARAVEHQKALDRPASSNPKESAARGKATARKLRAQRLRDRAEP